MMQTNPTKTDKGLTLANRVTIVRILGVPVFVLLLIYYINGLKTGEQHDLQRLAALCIFALVAATDAVDGYLARSRNEITHLGRVLDPLADKALLLSGLILLTRPSLPGLEPHIPIWFTTLVISRDVVLIFGAAIIYYATDQLDIRPRITGKIATVLQMMTILWVLAQVKADYFDWLVALAGFFTLVSGLQYVVDGTRQLDKAGRRS